MVDIRQEGHNQRSAPQKRNMAHLRRCADCTPRKLSGGNGGGNKSQLSIGGNRACQTWSLRLISSPAPAARFSGCTAGAPSQGCRVSLLGADLWLRPSQWMLTVQNPKKSWLATKPACSLVDDAFLWPRLPLSPSGCPRLPVSGGGWTGPQPASSAQSFVL